METVTMQASTDVTYDSTAHQLNLATAGLYVITWQTFVDPGPLAFVNDVIYLEDLAGNIYGKSGQAMNSRSKATGFTIVKTTGQLTLQLVNRCGAQISIVTAISLDGVNYFAGSMNAFRLA